MSKIKAIISDADGTLVNTMYLIRHGQYEAAAIYLLSLGLQKNQIPKYSDYVTLLNKSVGGSTKDTFTKTFKLLLEKSQPEILKRIDFDLLDNSLSVIQDRIALLYVHPFHGLTELLTWMGTNKIKLGIFSSGYYHHIVRNFGVSLPALGHSDLYTLNSVGIRDRLEAFIKRAEAVYGIPQIAVITARMLPKRNRIQKGFSNLWTFSKLIQKK